MAESALKRRLAQVIDMLTYPSRKVDEWTYEQSKPFLGDNPEQAYASLGKMADAANIVGSIENVAAKGAKAAAKALDMSKEARMARAKEMGFDVDNPVYHGSRTGADIKSFKLPETEHGKAIFFSENPDFANNFASSGAPGEAVYKTLVKKGKTFDPDELTQIEQLRNYLSEKGLLKTHIDSMLDKANLQKLLNEEKLSTLKYNPTISEKELNSHLNFIKRNFTNWSVFEDPSVSKAIKDLGFDSMNVYEKGSKNLAIFDPKNIRSVNAAFDPAKASSKNILAGAAGAGIIGSQAKEAMDRRLGK